MKPVLAPFARAPQATVHAVKPVNLHRVLDTLVNNLEGMAYRCLLDGRWTMRFVSQGCTRLCGYSAHELLDPQRISWEAITHPEDRARVRQEIGAAIAQGQRFTVYYSITTRSGEVRKVKEQGIQVTDEAGQLVLEGFIEDVTDVHLTLEALAHAELRYRQIFEHAREGIFQTTLDGRYIAANPALALLYGYATPQELIADLSDIDRRLYVQPHRRERFARLMAAHGEVSNFESEVYRRDGSKIWISENARSVYDKQGAFVCFEGTVQDISERKQQLEQLEYQANYDTLTGLANRNLLRDRIAPAISHAERLGHFLAVVFIDLDHFKLINDSLGHDAGDQLLVEIAQRIRACMRASDTVARQSGDEFVLLLNEHVQAHSVISHLQRLLGQINQPVHLQGRAFQMGASMGVALYPQDGRDAQTLLKHADVAMYAAKERGRNNFQFFTPELNQVADERLNLGTAMRVGLEQNEFTVAYQPKVDAQGRITGLEALARWHSARIGTVGPDRFIPIAEETGLIGALTDTILRQAFADACSWAPVQGRQLSVAVNLSAKLFLSNDLVARIRNLLQASGLEPQRVELEITESVFLHDMERAVVLLNELKALGVRLAMDDFGTGYSSLSYLRSLPLDTIKIDRSLITGIEQDEDLAMIACAIVNLCKNLRKSVVAEGVENRAQFDLLQAKGCDGFQGYLFSKPVHQDALRKLLAQAQGTILLPPTEALAC
ncbi:MAG: EAL domain-containing protein [Burkholderiales bacterium]|nr:EAL domain-containing protein [Burkholderiales bacterium]